MFPFPIPTNEIVRVENAIKDSKTKQKKEQDDKMVFRSSPKIYNNSSNSGTVFTKTEFSLNAMDLMLENEKNNNKTESWNKLDKTVKIQKLHMFAEKYGKEHGFPIKDVKILKSFFVDCLEKNKLSKTKDLIYDKDANEITGIPSLHFNSTNHSFTLKNMDPKRVSTLKALSQKGFSKLPNSSGSLATFRVSSEEATRNVSPLPNSSGDLRSPSELVVTPTEN
jgi:hypothetical protein